MDVNLVIWQGGLVENAKLTSQCNQPNNLW
jgi:hypothetical protein